MFYFPKKSPPTVDADFQKLGIILKQVTLSEHEESLIILKYIFLYYREQLGFPWVFPALSR